MLMMTQEIILISPLARIIRHGFYKRLFPLVCPPARSLNLVLYYIHYSTRQDGTDIGSNLDHIVNSGCIKGETTKTLGFLIYFLVSEQLFPCRVRSSNRHHGETQSCCRECVGDDRRSVLDNSNSATDLEVASRKIDTWAVSGVGRVRRISTFPLLPPCSISA